MTQTILNLPKKTYKTTRQRQTVVKVLQTASRPLSARSIFTKAQEIYPSLGLATVYRTLEILSIEGIIQQIKTKYSPAYYLNEQGSASIFCTGCGNHSPKPPALAKALAQAEREMGLKKQTLRVVGLCLDCTNKL